MKVTVVYGQNHHGITWNMTQVLIAKIAPDALDEFFLPADGPGCCLGCHNCFLDGESEGPHAEKMAPILKSMLSSEVIILAGPNYVDGMTGAMKDFSDHMAFAWMSHRPQPEMFSKIGVVIASSAGAMNGNVLSAMAKQLRSWMVPCVYEIGLVSHAWDYGGVSPRKKKKIDSKCSGIARKIRVFEGKVPFGLRQRLMFAIFRSMQSGKAAWNETDRRWWEEHGWLGKVRPWKKRNKETTWGQDRGQHN